MAVETGYSKIVTSGSMLVYDTGDTFNSWKGKPGTNIVTSIGYIQGTNTGTYYKTNYGTEIDNIPALGGDTLVNYINIYNDYPNSGNCCIALFGFGSAIPLSGNTTYTYQLVYKTPGGENGAFLYRYEYGASGYITENGVWSSGNTTNLGNGWKHAWGQFTTNVNTTNGYFYMFFYEYAQWYHIQVYSCSITAQTAIYPPRQFIPVNSTRTNTQGLLDLSGGGTTLDLSSMSYTSTAQMTFDGTDDYIPTGKTAAQLGMYDQSYTAECLCYPTSFLNDRTMFGTDGTGLRQGLHLVFRSGTIYMGHYSSDYSAGTGTLNEWNHIVFRFNKTGSPSGTASIFKNGVLQGSGTIDSFIGTTNIQLGRWGSASYFSGNIAVQKIYNRALSDSEILSNYNHYKTRFNLP